MRRHVLRVARRTHGDRGDAMGVRRVIEVPEQERLAVAGTRRLRGGIERLRHKVGGHATLLEPAHGTALPAQVEELLVGNARHGRVGSWPWGGRGLQFLHRHAAPASRTALAPARSAGYLSQPGSTRPVRRSPTCPRSDRADPSHATAPVPQPSPRCSPRRTRPAAAASRVLSRVDGRCGGAAGCSGAAYSRPRSYARRPASTAAMLATELAAQEEVVGGGHEAAARSQGQQEPIEAIGEIPDEALEHGLANPSEAPGCAQKCRIKKDGGDCSPPS